MRAIRAGVLYSFADMVQARLLVIAADYEDCDDIDAVRTDATSATEAELGADDISSRCSGGRPT